MARQVVIVGGGEVGTYVAALLLGSGHHVRVLEKRPEEIPRLQQALGLEVVLPGDGTDPGVLENAGIRQAQVVAAVTGTDETNLVVTGLARFAFQVPRTIARVHTPAHAWMFTPAMGVDVALNQADILGHLIAEEMSLGDMMTVLKLRRGQYALVEEHVHPTAVAAGQAIGTLALPPACALTALWRQGKLLLPHAELVLQPGDEVLALVHVSQAKQLEALLGQAT